jgi:hypothetical protein
VFSSLSVASVNLTRTKKKKNDKMNDVQKELLRLSAQVDDVPPGVAALFGDLEPISKELEQKAMQHVVAKDILSSDDEQLLEHEEKQRSLHDEEYTYNGQHVIVVKTVEVEEQEEEEAEEVEEEEKHVGDDDNDDDDCDLDVHEKDDNVDNVDGATSQVEHVAMTGWSDARKESYGKIHSNPNAYFYRFNRPDEPQVNGTWSDAEKALFFERMKVHRPSTSWGIFSQAIPGRVGYQCANFYRRLIETGEIVDENYYLDENGKAHFKTAKYWRRVAAGQIVDQQGTPKKRMRATAAEAAATAPATTAATAAAATATTTTAASRRRRRATSARKRRRWPTQTGNTEKRRRTALPPIVDDSIKEHPLLLGKYPLASVLKLLEEIWDTMRGKRHYDRWHWDTVAKALDNGWTQATCRKIWRIVQFYGLPLPEGQSEAQLLKSMPTIDEDDSHLREFAARHRLIHAERQVAKRLALRMRPSAEAVKMAIEEAEERRKQKILLASANQFVSIVDDELLDGDDGDDAQVVAAQQPPSNAIVDDKEGRDSNALQTTPATVVASRPQRLRRPSMRAIQSLEQSRLEATCEAPALQNEQEQTSRRQQQEAFDAAVAARHRRRSVTHLAVDDPIVQKGDAMVDDDDDDPEFSILLTSAPTEVSAVSTRTSRRQRRPTSVFELAD